MKVFHLSPAALCCTLLRSLPPLPSASAGLYSNVLYSNRKIPVSAFRCCIVSSSDGSGVTLICMMAFAKLWRQRHNRLKRLKLIKSKVSTWDKCSKGLLLDSARFSFYTSASKNYFRNTSPPNCAKFFHWHFWHFPRLESARSKTKASLSFTGSTAGGSLLLLLLLLHTHSGRHRFHPVWIWWKSVLLPGQF